MPEHKMLGIVYTNVRDEKLRDLTRNRTMGSIPFGGRYRMVDFPLSNMVNSGISDVGIVTPSNYHSLMDHLGTGVAWDLSRKNGGLSIFPPYSRSGSGIYRGSLEALGGILSFIRENDAGYVVICDTDNVCNIDLRGALDFHRQHGEGITLLYCRDANLLSENSGTRLVIGRQGELLDALPVTAADTDYNRYMNISIFDKDLLVRIVDDAMTHSRYSFMRDILQSEVGRRHARCLLYEGFCTAITSLDSFFGANMQLLRSEVRADLFRSDRPIYTKVRDEVPAKYGLRANVTGSLVADGCIIDGTVENSVIFRGVRIGRGAVVRNSIIMQGSTIGDNADMNYVVTDKNVLIKDGRKLAGYNTFPMYIPKKTQI